MLLLAPGVSFAGVTITAVEKTCPLSLECPKTAERWLGLRQLEAAGATSCKSAQYASCMTTMSPSVKACFGPFLELLRLEEQTESADMGPTRYQDSYYKQEPVKSKTALSTLPRSILDPLFLAKIKDPRTLSDAIREFKKSNPKLTVIRYSGIAKALDVQNRDLDRLLIVVPGSTEDRYYQFTIPTLEDEKVAASEKPPDLKSKSFLNSTLYTQLSMILVDKSEVRSPTDRPKVYFRDYTRTGGSGGITVGFRNETDSSKESCLRCHNQGVQPIFPNLDRTRTEDALAIERLNGKMIEYGIPANSSARIPHLPSGMSTVGLPLGPVNPPSRTEEFMASCAPDLSAERRAYLRQSMNCMGCHNGEPVRLTPEVPTLAKAFSWGAYELAPIYNVGGGVLETLLTRHSAMPPGWKGTPEERKALWNCLSTENRTLSEEAQRKLREEYSCEGLALSRLSPGKPGTPSSAASSSPGSDSATKVETNEPPRSPSAAGSESAKER